MKRLLRFFRPSRIGAQIAIVLVAAVVLAQFAVATLFFLFGPVRGPLPRPEGLQLGMALRILESAPAGPLREQMFASLAREFPKLELRPVKSVPENGRRFSDRSTPTPPGFSEDIGAREAWMSPPGENGKVLFTAALADGSLIQATLTFEPPRPFAPFIFGLLVFVAVSLTMLSLWAARALARPLSRFADAAEHFDLDADHQALPETGPDEVRVAAQAFNAMRDRIKTLIEERRQAFAAVSHDLRTPITRLRLRAEGIDDDAVRAPIVRDLEQMNAMVDAALSFLRGGSRTPPMLLLDLSALLQTVCDQFADLGAPVSFSGPERVEIAGASEELERAVTNLVENAVRYGTRVVVHLSLEDGFALIDVEDDGPGIPSAERTRLLQPFVRGDEARTMTQSSGFGLGLAIATAIAGHHGGSLSLHDATPHGLVARLRLPIRSQQRARASSQSGRCALPQAPEPLTRRSA